MQVRFEAFNATNRVTFGAPRLSPTNAAFGQISTQANTPRVEAGLRLVWQLRSPVYAASLTLAGQAGLFIYSCTCRKNSQRGSFHA